MTPFPGGFWLESWRLEVQSFWFGLFGIALWSSIVALHFPHRAAISRLARALWALSIVFFFGMWIAGATLEMMRRAAAVSGVHLLVTLAAFSLLLAGTFSLVREGFGTTWNQPLRAARMSLTLLVLTLVGWFLGGLTLESNSLWNFAPAGFTAPYLQHPRAPDGWALSLGGAALWNAAAWVQSRDATTLRVRNPRAALWFLLMVALLLMLRMGARNPAAASVFLFGAGLFGFKIWRVRADCPRFLRSNWRLRGPLLLMLAAFPLLVAHPNFRFWTEFWATRIQAAWFVPSYFAPSYFGAFAALLSALIWLFWRGRAPLRAAISGQFSQRALLGGALGGFFGAALLFGPAGTIYWAFWPLAGVFFDLLSARETFRNLSSDSDFSR